MKRLALPGLALVASLAILVPTASSQDDGANGGISMTVHTHSSEFRGPGGAELLEDPTDPLSAPIAEEDFSYSSVPCANPAPFNDVGLKFNPDYPGIDDPAKVRHVIEGEVTDVSKSGKQGTVEGTLTTFLCDGDTEGDRIDFEFDGKLIQKSDNEALFRGTFDIVGGTGRFEDLDGQGSMHGRLTCLPSVLERTGKDSCADLGKFTDAVFFRGGGKDPSPSPADVTGGLKGHYEDPTA